MTKHPHLPTRSIFRMLAGPVVLVGHSYGGMVITEAGNNAKVAQLVYIAAFAPDQGESLQKLLANPAPGAVAPPILAPVNGFLTLDKAQFAAAFAADVDAGRASFLAHAQRPWGVAALAGEINMPAWRTKPSWYLVAQDDRMIPADAQRSMSRRAGATVVESPGSHAIHESQPATVAALIERAAGAKP